MKKIIAVFSSIMFCVGIYAQDQSLREKVNEKSASTILDDHPNINPDKKFHWREYGEPEWDIRDEIFDLNYFRFYTLNSGMYAVQSSRDETYVYKFNHTDNAFYHQDIVNNNDYVPNYDPLLFEHKESVYLLEYKTDGSVTHLYRHAVSTEKLDDYKHNKWDTYQHDKSTDKKQHRIYRAACSIGDFVYLIYDSYTEDNKLYHIGNGKDIRIIKCSFDENHKMKEIKKWTLNDVESKKHYHPYAASWFTHPDGKPRLLISYSGEHNNDKENQGGGVVVFNPHSGKHTHIYKNDDHAFSIRAIYGSLKAQRENPIGSKKDKHRIQIFYNHFHDSNLAWKDKGTFTVKTLKINNEGKYETLGYENIVLGDKDYYPDEWNRMSIDVTNMLEGKEDNTSDSEHSSAEKKYQQHLWMFYTDKHGHIRGCKFTSDKWQYIPETAVRTDDLSDTKTYGEDVKKTWTLIGIVEGAPPTSINWAEWDDNHAEHIEPSSFSWTLKKTEEVKVTAKNTKSAFVGVSIGDDILDVGVEVSGKFTGTFEHETQQATVVVTEKNISLGLNEKAQVLGAKFYLIPDIERLTYGTFPWWEKEIKTENASSIQYRFVTIGYFTHQENISLDNELFGLNLDSLNTKDLTCWTKNNSDRLWIINNNTYADILDLSWTNPHTGDDQTLELIKHSSITQSTENTIEFSASAKAKIFKVERGFSASWKRGVEIASTLTNGFNFSYEYLIKKDSGPNISGIETKVLFFPPNKKADLPFKKHLEKEQNPWYIAYLVTKVTPYDIDGNINNTQLIENAPNDLIVYPNPSDGKELYLQINNSVSQQYKVKIYNSSGIELVSKELESSKGSKYIPLTFKKQLLSGMYLIRIIGKCDNTVNTRKFVVN